MKDGMARNTEDILHDMILQRENFDNCIIFSYVTSWSQDLPDPFSITHLSYAFATIGDDFKSIAIKNEEKFKEIVRLKEINPELKVLLSIGGWGAGNFSEMALSTESRGAFINSAMNVVRRYNIDGLDIDWEYPGSSLGNITSSNNDKSNFTKLIKQIRDSIGELRLLSFASPSYGNYFEYENVVPYVDFINIMTYDIAVPPHHHAPINHSKLTGKITLKDVIADHYKKGVPANKMLLGIPFYGRGNEKDYKRFQDFRYIKTKEYAESKFDTTAVAPYIANKKTGEMLISFDDTTSVKAKCILVKEIGLKGVMIWHYSGDTPEHSLLKHINQELR